LQHESGKAMLTGERFRFVSKGRVEEMVVKPEDVGALLLERFLLDGNR